MQEVEARLLRARDRLGTTLRSAVAVLYAEGCTGRPDDSLACVLQRYYRRALDLPVAVGSGIIQVIVPGSGIMEIRTTELEKQIVLKFDAGRIPLLEDNKRGARYRRRHKGELERLVRQLEARRAWEALRQNPLLPDINYVTSEPTPDGAPLGELTAV